MSTFRLSRNWPTVLLVAVAYVIAGKIGLRLASVNASATAVWPPTGIALAALLLFGYRAWPGVLLGAFVVNLTTAGTVATSIGIAIGNTLEGVLGAWLVQRFASGVRAFERPRDLFVYAGLAGLVATAVSASIGVMTLSIGGLVAPEAHAATWLTWWLGDMAGALVVAPFLVLWGRPPAMTPEPVRRVEAALMLVLLLATGLAVFMEASPLGGTNYPLEFLCAPPLLWAAFRFTPREASSGVVILSALAIWGTLRGLGPFGRFDPSESLLLLQAFMAVTSLMVLTVGTAVAERRRAEERERELNAALERRVLEGTGKLRAANRELEDQMVERQRASEELERSEARLREAQRVARIGSWEWDIERNLVWWSEALYWFYGVDPARFGASYEAFLECVHPDDREHVHRTVSEALNARQPFSMEHRVVRPDGAVVHFHAQGRVEVDATGKAVRMMGIGQDITMSKRAEEERAALIREQAAGREAEQANRLKDEFLATLSHELRTPLNAILNWARLLRDGSLDGPARERAIGAINRNADQQNRLILELLDLTRITSGRLELRLQPFEPETVIEGALDSVRPSADAKGIHLHAAFDASGGRVVGDTGRLQQVLTNLLANAIRLTHDGGNVALSMTREAGAVHFRVEDDGPGIDPELLPRIFDRFTSGRLSPQHGGLGLGLAIVKHLTELHGGSVRASNRPTGSGAVFEVFLPLPTAIGSENGAREPDPAAWSRDSDRQVGGLCGLRILVVEDDLDSREALALLLTGWGAQVELAGSCAEAMAIFAARPPEFLISDIGIPGEDGYALIAKVRELPAERGGAVPAIALTAYAGGEHAGRARAYGFQTHVAKPFEPGDLRATIALLVRQMPAQNWAAAHAPRTPASETPSPSSRTATTSWLARPASSAPEPAPHGSTRRPAPPRMPIPARTPASPPNA